MKSSLLGRRGVGAGLCCVGLVAAWLGSSFTVTFPTDPLGPAAFPVFAGTLLFLGGAGGVLVGGAGSLPSTRLSRVLWASLGIALYAWFLEPVGFLLGTGCLVAMLGRLYGGRWAVSAAVGILLSLSLFGLFAYGLGLVLPTGTLW